MLDLIKKRAIVRSEDQTLISSTGGTLEWLIDLRRILLMPEALDIITTEFWDKFKDKLPFQIGGMEVAGVPLVTALIMKAHELGLDVNGFLIRKERKTTGLCRLIEGNLTKDPVVLVDDILNSGQSLEKARAIIAQEGKDICDVFVLINYHSRGGQDWLNHHSFSCNSLFDLAEFDLNLNENYTPPKFSYRVAWRFYEKGAFPFHVVPKSTPLLVGEYLYMGAESGKLFCIDRYTGQEVWSFDTQTHHKKGIWSSPVHHQGQIFFGAYNGIFYCLEAKTGKEIWRNPACEFIGSSPCIAKDHGLVFVGLEYQRPRMMGSNAAFDIKTSQRVWEVGQKKYQHGSGIYYAPMDAVIFGNADHNVSAYEARSGKMIWQHKTERSIKYPPTVDEKRGRVIATSFDGNIYILDVKTGERIGTVKTNDICYTSALITHDKIFAGSGDQHMYIIDADSLKLIKKMDCFARVYSSPRLLNDHVVFGTNGGMVIELDPETLEIAGYCQLPDAVTNAVSASDDGQFLYVSTHMNELYCVVRTPASANALEGSRPSS